MQKRGHQVGRKIVVIQRSPHTTLFIPRELRHTKENPINITEFFIKKFRKSLKPFSPLFNSLRRYFFHFLKKLSI